MKAMRSEMHEQFYEVHLEIIKQLQIQQMEQKKMFEEYNMERNEMKKMIETLKTENNELKKRTF